MKLEDILAAIQKMGKPNLNGVGTNYGPVYTEPGLASLGGFANLPGGNEVGGTLGVDNGQPFGSANVNGNNLGSFGPQDGGAQGTGINLQAILKLLGR